MTNTNTNTAATTSTTTNSTIGIKAIHIFVRNLEGTPVVLAVSTDELVSSVKAKLQGKEGVPVDQQRLVFGGKQLEDDRTLGHYNVQNESTIDLQLRLLGGMFPVGFGMGGMPMAIVNGQPMPVMGGGMMMMGGHPVSGTLGVPLMMGGGGQQVIMRCKYCNRTMDLVGTSSGDGVYDCDCCERRIAFDPRTHDIRTLTYPGGSSSRNGSSGQTHRSRESRLREGRTQTLYHQTTEEAAKAIIESQRFRRGGSDCAVGSGIYFAESPSDTDRKARNRGVILEAEVQLGCVKHLSHREPHSFSRLNSEGYDSIRLTCFNGDEIIVFNWDQVSNIRRH